MLKKDLIMIQFKELGKMVTQMVFNRENHAEYKNRDLIQTIYQTLHLTQGALMTSSLEDLLRLLDREDNGGFFRMELAARNLMEESFIQPKERTALLKRSKEILVYIQQHDKTYSIGRVMLLNEIEKWLQNT